MLVDGQAVGNGGRVFNTGMLGADPIPTDLYKVAELLHARACVADDGMQSAYTY